MRKILLVLCLFLFAVACQPKASFICSDGTIVDDPFKCIKPSPEKEAAEPPEIERVAKLFGIYWQNKEYGKIYRYLHPSLKALKTEKEFLTIFELSGLIEDDISVVFQSFVFESDNSAYANYVITNRLGTIRPVSLRMEFIENNWRVNVFEDILSKETLGAACGQAIDLDSCAFAAAKRLDRITYCEQTGCYYDQCLIHFGQVITSRDRKHYCDLCEVPDCLQKQAMKYRDVSLCEELDESTQFTAFDKYYYCYGNVANAFKDISVCETLEPDVFRYACKERYNNPQDSAAKRNDVFRTFTRMYFARPAY